MRHLSQRKHSMAVELPMELPEARPLQFEAVYREQFRLICRLIGYLGVARSDVDDVAQQVFQVVLRRLPDFRGDNLLGWLYAITRRVCASHRRKSALLRLLLGRHDDPVERLDPAQGGEVALQRKRLVEAALGQLSEKLRTPFILFEVEGFTMEEIAALLELPQGTVASRLRLARKQFAALTQGEEAP